MSKYSKKLVSKCIYIQILKCTETELLGQFMSVGGWSLVHAWLQDGIESKNWPLVQELLELLLLCPVDVPRLQSNSAPKLVKGLSREEENDGKCSRILSTVNRYYCIRYKLYCERFIKTFSFYFVYLLFIFSQAFVYWQRDSLSNGLK